MEPLPREGNNADRRFDRVITLTMLEMDHPTARCATRPGSGPQKPALRRFDMNANAAPARRSGRADHMPNV